MNDFASVPPSETAATRPPAIGAAKRAPPGVAAHARGLVRFLYTNNPFYVVSAGLVLWGLRLSFAAGGESLETLALMGGLAGYTLLLAAAACLLIRFGDVWEDVRTILLLSVLMFLAISVTFDETLATNPRLGTVCFFGGLMFSILLSEGLLWGIRLSLPTLFRLPYYLILALFFLYPVAISPLVPDYADPRIHWGLFGFASIAGLIFLTLLPAVRRGPRYVRHNGSPWRWPWYPWVLFGVLGFGVCGRALFLCMSLDPMKSPEIIFGLYFLVPFLLAANILLLEVGIVSDLHGVTRLALIGPAGLLALAVSPRPADAADLGFLEMFSDTLGGSPLFFTLMAAAAFYVVALLRRVPHAASGLTATLAVLAVCGPSTFNPATPVEPRGLPILLIAVLQMAIAIRTRSAPRCLFAACCLLTAIGLDFRGTAFTAHGGLIPLHLLLAAVLFVGAVFHDPFGKLMQHLGAALILLAAVLSVTTDPQLLGNPPPLLLSWYPALAIGTAVAYGCLVGNRWYFAAALGSLAGWLAVGGWHAYRQLRQTIMGLDQIAWGILFFLLAVLVSLTKTGILQGSLHHRRNED